MADIAELTGMETVYPAKMSAIAARRFRRFKRKSDASKRSDHIDQVRLERGLYGPVVALEHTGPFDQHHWTRLCDRRRLYTLSMGRADTLRRR